MNPESISEILQVIFLSWKNNFKIKQDLIIVTDEKYWFTLHGENKFAKLYGGSNKKYGYVFINIDKIPTYKELTQTIIHELLHIKYWTKTESQIKKLEKKFLS